MSRFQLLPRALRVASRVLFVGLSLTSLVEAQQWSRTYRHSEVNDHASCMVELEGGDLLVAGQVFEGSVYHSTLLRLDRHGNRRWARRYGDAQSQPLVYSMVRTDSGDPIAVGSFGNRSWIARLDATDGSLVWQRTTSPRRGVLVEAVRLRDGTFAAVGRMEGEGFDDDLLVIRFGEYGQVYAHDQYGQRTRTEVGSGITATADGGYAVVGTVWGTTDLDLMVARFDDRSALVWHRQYGTTGSDGGTAIVETSDARLAVVGARDRRHDTEDDFWLLHLEASGDRSSEYRYGHAFEQATDLVATADGGVVISGTTSEEGQPDSGAMDVDTLLVKVAGSGEIDWALRVGGQHFENPRALHALADGDLLVTGDSVSFSGSERSDTWLLRLDPEEPWCECCPIAEPIALERRAIHTPEIVEAITRRNVFVPVDTATTVAPSTPSCGQQCAVNAGAWSDLGEALSGTEGEPCQAGLGTLHGGGHVASLLTRARPDSWAVYAVGTRRLDAPFRGGVMVPDPRWILPPLSTGVDGTLSLSMTWPTGLPSGMPLFVQVLVLDPEAVRGMAMSNAVGLITP